MRIPFTIFLVSLAVWQVRAQALGEGYADLVERISSAVVFVQTTRDEVPRGSGSGFLISEDGYLVTNRHVIADSQTITVDLLDGKSLKATVVGADNSLDIALLKIEGSGLNYLSIGNSTAMRIGDPVLALGYPLALGFSVTSGIISGIGRDIRTGNMDLAAYIQTDADISHGSSGGPLVNDKGEVIGINTLIIPDGVNFGFAIPSEVFRTSIDQLRRFGKVRRGALGIQVGNLSSKVRAYYDLDHGAQVASVTSGFPAQRAGLKPDDVILEVDGVKVRDRNDVVSLIAAKPPGAKVSLKIMSAGRESLKQVTLGDRNKLVRGEDRPDPPKEEARPENLGLAHPEETPANPRKTARDGEQTAEEPVAVVAFAGDVALRQDFEPVSSSPVPKKLSPF